MTPTMIQDQARMLLGRSPLFIDTETTSLRQPEVIELGVVDAEGEKVLERRYRPLGTMAEEALAVHGIEAEDLEDRPMYREDHDQVIQTLSRHCLVAYNSPFDSRALSNTIQLHGLSPPEPPFQWQCAMNLALHWYGLHTDQPTMPWLSQEEVARRLGILGSTGGEFLDAHEAVADARMTWQVLKCLAEGAY